MSVTILDEENRRKLAEGRSTGMGFAFLKRKNQSTYKTVMPITCCKDFLNEVIYAEVTKKFQPRIFGMLYDKRHNILTKDYAYLAIKILPQNSNTAEYSVALKADKDSLEKNHSNIMSFMREIETKLGIKKSKQTKIVPADNDTYLVAMPIYWTTQPYLVSMYTLLMRAFQYYDGSMPALEYLEKGKVYSADSALIMSSRKKMLEVINGAKVKQTYEQYATNVSSLHSSSGICSMARK